MPVFNEYHSVDRACKKVIFTLIPEAYLRSFKNKYTRYANVKCLEILSHLWIMYGVLQDYEVQENYVKMKKPSWPKTYLKILLNESRLQSMQ